MKDRKRRVELYSFYDHTGMERHLERMAGKGWFLEKIENNFWHYRRLQPQKLRYFVTYFPKAGELDPEPSEEQKTFYDFCGKTLLRDAVRSHGETGSFDELKDPASWGAQKAYQFTGKDRERMNWYLLCYPNRIVQIWFSWTPSERQKETVGERLS